MKKIALTGSLHSGIEDVSKIFMEKGIPVFDADVVSKFIINYNYPVIQKIKVELGNNVFTDGFLDPKKFNNTQKFDRLLDIINLELLKSFENWSQKQQSFKYVMFKYNILFERKLDDYFDEIVTVYKPKVERAKIMKQLTNMPMSSIHDTLDDHMNEFYKNKISKYIIHNYELATCVNTQVNEIHKNLW